MLRDCEYICPEQLHYFEKGHNYGSETSATENFCHGFGNAGLLSYTQDLITRHGRPDVPYLKALKSVKSWAKVAMNWLSCHGVLGSSVLLSFLVGTRPRRGMAICR